MYKVVTHTIKEEHFEHPHLAEKGMAIHNGHGNHGNTKPYYGTVRPVSRDVRGRNSDVITPHPPDGNVIVKMPLNEDWGGYDYWGQYHCWGDLTIHGSTVVSGDLTVEGAIVGRGTTSNVIMLETAPTTNTWAGNVGDLAKNTNFMYLCVEQDKWIRWSIQSTW
jgi:hypothetical protein